MTPKQKAQYMYTTIKDTINSEDDSFNREARDCALYCVYEIIEVCEEYDNYLEGELSHADYWREVKDHLEDQLLAL